MSRKINIAIDGYSSCGKGTLAKMLALRLSYLFIDTGAMYRAVTLAMLRNGTNIHDEQAVASLLPDLRISFEQHPKNAYYHTLLNGVDVESEIRGMPVSNAVSAVSKIAAVRDFLVKQQQALGKDKGVVMDGRDIGTVVFPDAELKLFMTARPEIRAMRRYRELQEKGDKSIRFEEVLQNLISRDKTDSERENSPLKPAIDAIVLDNSELSREDQFEFALEKALQIIQSQA